MRVHELIAELEMMDEDAEVRLAIQPSYPFQHDIASVVEVEVTSGHGPDVDEMEEELGDLREQLRVAIEEGDHEDEIADLKEEIRNLMVAITKAEDEASTIVYIAEGGQNYDAPYLPGAASRELGWR